MTTRPRERKVWTDRAACQERLWSVKWPRLTQPVHTNTHRQWWTLEKLLWKLKEPWGHLDLWKCLQCSTLWVDILVIQTRISEAGLYLASATTAANLLSPQKKENGGEKYNQQQKILSVHLRYLAMFMSHPLHCSTAAHRQDIQKHWGKHRCLWCGDELLHTVLIQRWSYCQHPDTTESRDINVRLHVCYTSLQ